jgi:hypothetical protein
VSTVKSLSIIMLRTILLLVALAGSHAFVTSNGQRPAFVSIVVVGQRGRRQNCQQRLFMGMAQVRRHRIHI